MRCPNCGARMGIYVICPECGWSKNYNPSIRYNPAHNKNVAGILALLLGQFGFHKFYQRQWVWGLMYLLLCFTGISRVISIFEGIAYLLMDESAYNSLFR